MSARSAVSAERDSSISSAAPARTSSYDRKKSGGYKSGGYKGSNPRPGYKSGGYKGGQKSSDHGPRRAGTSSYSKGKSYGGKRPTAALDRNLCRCGSHNRMVRAVLRAAAEMAAG